MLQMYDDFQIANSAYTRKESPEERNALVKESLQKFEKVNRNVIFVGDVSTEQYLDLRYILSKKYRDYANEDKPKLSKKVKEYAEKIKQECDNKRNACSVRITKGDLFDNPEKRYVSMKFGKENTNDKVILTCDGSIIDYFPSEQNANDFLTQNVEDYSSKCKEMRFIKSQSSKKIIPKFDVTYFDTMKTFYKD